MMRTRHALHVVLASLAVAGVALTSAPAAIAQQDWPSRPVRIVVPYPPGALTDLLARAIGDRLGTAMKQPFVIENKPGAGTLLGAEVVAKSAPDGYTLLMATSTTLGISPALYRSSPIDPIRDFAPVSQVGSVNFFLIANPAFPAKTVGEAIEAIRGNPGKFNYASVGIGSPGHIAGELFKLKTGVQMTHVPYKGGGPAVTDTIGGQVQLLFVSMPAAWQHVKSGRLKALAVTSAKRSIAAPDLPTIAEQGVPEVVVDSWYGLLVPAKTPAPVVAKLNAAMVKVLQTPEVREKLLAQGAEAASSSSADFEALIRDELKKWDYVIREAKITPE